jgi:6-phosphofructokinase 1
VYIIREGWEGLVRGNSDEPKFLKEREAIEKGHEFVATYGEGDYIRGGEAESLLKGRYIIRVGWDDVSGFLSVVSLLFTFYDGCFTG